MSTMPPKPEPTAERFMPPGCGPNYDLIVATAPPFVEATAEMFMPPECRPNYDLIVTEDHQPVDSLYSEILIRLLTSVLYETWPGPGAGRTFLAAANVGLFYSFNTPPVVPDVMLSLDVPLGDPKEKKNRSYFLWEHGKAPDKRRSKLFRAPTAANWGKSWTFTRTLASLITSSGIPICFSAPSRFTVSFARVEGSRKTAHGFRKSAWG